MINDPIVDEIHQIRARLLDECNGDLDQLLDRYKASEDQNRGRMVTLKDVQRQRELGDSHRRNNRATKAG